MRTSPQVRLECGGPARLELDLFIVAGHIEARAEVVRRVLIHVLRVSTVSKVTARSLMNSTSCCLPRTYARCSRRRRRGPCRPRSGRPCPCPHAPSSTPRRTASRPDPPPCRPTAASHAPQSDPLCPCRCVASLWSARTASASGWAAMLGWRRSKVPAPSSGFQSGRGDARRRRRQRTGDNGDGAGAKPLEKGASAGRQWHRPRAACRASVASAAAGATAAPRAMAACRTKLNATAFAPFGKTQPLRQTAVSFATSLLTAATARRRSSNGHCQH